jgi:GAF domain-containing protein
LVDERQPARTAIGCLVQDVTGPEEMLAAESRGREAAERASVRMTLLQDITARLSEARDQTEVAHVVVDAATKGVGATSGTVVLLDEHAGTFETLASVGPREAATRHWWHFTMEQARPVADAIRTRRPVLLSTPQERNARYPCLAGFETPQRSWAIIPLVAHGAAVGAVAFGWPTPHAFTKDAVAWMSAIANQCAVALDRARLYDAERDARRQLEFLSEASASLAVSLDVGEVVRRIVALLVPEHADAAAVHLVDQSGLRLVGFADTGGGRAAKARPAVVDAAGVAAPVPGTPPHLVSGALTDVVRIEPGTAGPPLPVEIAKLVSELGPHSALVVPVRSGPSLLAVVTLARFSAHPGFPRTTRELMTELATRAGSAITNARAHDEMVAVAHTLQASLLPPSLPRIPGFEVVARYRPVPGIGEVGGDFYDVLEVVPGRWSVTIGDVSGKGILAASLTALARHTIRVAARREPGPGAVLSVLNDAVLAADVGDKFATVAQLRLAVTDSGQRTDAEAGGVGTCTAVLAVAGHPLPLVLRASGTVQAVGKPGMGVGLFPGADFPETPVWMGPGDALVLYTDGYLDARGPGGQFADDLLERTLGTLAGRGAEEIAQTLDAAVADFQRGNARDDTALLVVRRLTGVREGVAGHQPAG